MEHIKLILTIFNLVMGACIIMLLLLRNNRGREHGIFGFLAMHTLAYNLLLILASAGKYIHLNLSSQITLTSNSSVHLLSDGIFVFSLGLMVLSQYMIRQRFHNQLIAYKKVLTVTASFFIILFLSASLFRLVNPQISSVIMESGSDLAFLSELILIILIYWDSRSVKNPQLSRFIKIYSLLYLSRYPLIVLLVFIPDAPRFYLGLLTLFYFNLIPLVFWGIIFRLTAVFDGSEVENQHSEYFFRYGISKREGEIAALVLKGFSNRDIENFLHISSHTVKNHIYNIYRKCSVNSRFELISLFSKNKPY